MTLDIGGVGASSAASAGADWGGGLDAAPADNVAESWSGSTLLAQAGPQPGAGQPLQGAPAGKEDTASLAKAKLDAAFCADVYSDTPHPPAGWHVASAADLQKLNLKPKDLDDPNHHFKARVYSSDSDGSYTVAFRGTENLKDWKTNIRQAFDKNTGAYRDALTLGGKLASSKASVELTGHSLGGGLASAAAVASGRHADTFNASGLSPSTLAAGDRLRAAAGSAPRPQVDAFYVKGEALHALQDGGDLKLSAAIFGSRGRKVDAPSAFGTEHALDPVKPPRDWKPDLFGPIDRHLMAYVQSSVDGALQHAGR